MSAVRTLWRMTAGLINALAPVTTLFAALALLLLGVHGAAQPVAHLAQSLLDGLDSVVDAVLKAALTWWGDWDNWTPARLDSEIEAAISYIDIPEKMAAVHVVGLLLEGTLFAVFFHLAWNADPWMWPGWMRPRAALDALKKWWRGLPKWTRAERVIVVPLVVTGVYAAARDMRTAVVALLASSDLDVPLDAMGTLGWTAFLATVYVALAYAGMPVLTSSPQASLRAGKTRRLIILASSVLWLMALVEEVLL